MLECKTLYFQMLVYWILYSIELWLFQSALYTYCTVHTIDYAPFATDNYSIELLNEIDNLWMHYNNQMSTFAFITFIGWQQKLQVYIEKITTGL